MITKFEYNGEGLLVMGTVVHGFAEARNDRRRNETAISNLDINS